jgi:hypothetical protein
LARPYLEKTLHKKRAGGVAQVVGPEFKPQYSKKKLLIFERAIWRFIAIRHQNPNCLFQKWKKIDAIFSVE